VVLKKRKRNASHICYAIRFVFPFTFIFPLLKIVTKYTHARAHTQKQFICCIGPFPSICIARDVFEIEFVDGSEACAIKYSVTRCTTVSTLSIQPQPLHSLFPEMYQKENRGLQEGIANPQAKLPCEGWMGWYCLMWGTKIKKDLGITFITWSVLQEFQLTFLPQSLSSYV